jgi:uncharacterized protein (DUF433 family)
MSIQNTEYKHIKINNQISIIEGTTMKVVELITSVKAYKWTPEVLNDNYPELSMSQIYSALAYYWDHKLAIDAEIERIDQWATKVHQEIGESALAFKLRNQGLL